MLNQKEGFDQKTGRDKFFKVIDEELTKLIDPNTNLIKKELTENVNCPICYKNSETLAFIKQGFQFWKCKDCQLIYVNPQLSSLRIKDYYRESFDTWMDVIESEENRKWQLPYFKKNLELAIEVGFPEGAILDVGCSSGLFLEVCKENNYTNVLGIELEKKARELALQKGLEVLDCELNAENLGENKFSLITLFGVLEHLPHPKLFLESAMKVLKPGGLILCVVPNLHSLTNMVLKEHARTFTGRNHLQYFSPPSLRKLLSSTGYEVPHISTVLEGYEALLNRLQYRDPFGLPESDFLPESIQNIFSNEQSKEQLTKWMHQNLLGLRVQAFGRKPKDESSRSY